MENLDVLGPTKERKPELAECLIAVEALSERLESLAIEIDSKIRSIYSPQLPVSDQNNMSHKNPDKNAHVDFLGKLNQEIGFMNMTAKKLQEIVETLNKII